MWEAAQQDRARRSHLEGRILIGDSTRWRTVGQRCIVWRCKCSQWVEDTKPQHLLSMHENHLKSLLQSFLAHVILRSIWRKTSVWTPEDAKETVPGIAASLYNICQKITNILTVTTKTRVGTSWCTRRLHVSPRVGLPVCWKQVPMKRICFGRQTRPTKWPFSSFGKLMGQPLDSSRML